jgi:hypothetical protein
LQYGTTWLVLSFINALALAGSLTLRRICKSTYDTMLAHH